MRPSAVRIIGKTYGIAYVNGDPLAEGEFGECDFDKQRVSIADSLHLEQEQDTVLHELLHAVAHETGVNLQERQVRPLATALLGIIKENPKLMTYLRRRK